MCRTTAIAYLRVILSISSCLRSSVVEPCRSFAEHSNSASHATVILRLTSLCGIFRHLYISMRAKISRNGHGKHVLPLFKWCSVLFLLYVPDRKCGVRVTVFVKMMILYLYNHTNWIVTKSSAFRLRRNSRFDEVSLKCSFGLFREKKRFWR